MNQNYFVKCSVCGALHRVRIQAGYLNDYPTRFYCGKCGVLIKGEVHLFPEEGSVVFELEPHSRADIVHPEIDPSVPCDYYLIECSGELLTRKTCSKMGTPLMDMTGGNPYFVAVMAFGQEELQEFIEVVDRFLYLIETEWPGKRVIFELFFNGDGLLAKQEIMKCLDPAEYPCSNPLELLGAIHDLGAMLMPVVYDEPFLADLNDMMDLLGMVDEGKSYELTSFLESCDMGPAAILKKTQVLIYEFVEHFEYLIPAYGLGFSRKEYDFEVQGTVSCSVEDIKQFYIDCYETLARLVVLFIGLDNIAERGSFDRMREGGAVGSYENLVTRSSKGNILRCADGGPFTSIGQKCWDRDLRNAFGHNSYELDKANQRIKIIGNNGRESEEKSVWVIEAACQCVNMFRYAMLIREAAFALIAGDLLCSDGVDAN